LSTVNLGPWLESKSMTFSRAATTSYNTAFATLAKMKAVGTRRKCLER
jgi:hypothetical protein